MTRLSVNLNKIALLRNSRGRDYPNVADFARRFIAAGADGITVHPREDERHAKPKDVRDLAAYLKKIPRAEFNVEGYPSDKFLQLVCDAQPDQCTLVPDDATQLTSDHGWNMERDEKILQQSIARLHAAKIRAAIFIDADESNVARAAKLNCDRVELYTQHYAECFARGDFTAALKKYKYAAGCAEKLGVGVNAGPRFGFAELKNISHHRRHFGSLHRACINRGMHHPRRRRDHKTISQDLHKRITVAFPQVANWRAAIVKRRITCGVFPTSRRARGRR